MADTTQTPAPSSNPRGGRSSGGPGFSGGRQGGRGGRRNRAPETPALDSQGRPIPEMTEKVVFINRSSKVVKGGRRFSFSALVVVGDQQGKVGVGLGKAGEVAEAIRKGNENARSQMTKISLNENTIPHEIYSRYCGARVLMRPASQGTGVIAGKTVRAVLDAVGVRDILTKSLGSKNPANVVKATLEGLKKLRLRAEIYKARGLEVKEPAPAAAEPAATSA